MVPQKGMRGDAACGKMAFMTAAKNMTTGNIVSNFTLFSSELFNVTGQQVNFFVTGTYSNGTAFAGCSGSNTTLFDGSSSYAWFAPDVGTFSVHASFPGNASYVPCDAYALVTVNTLPLSLLFSVSPEEPVSGCTFTLNATIMDPFTGAVSSNNVTVNFTDHSSSGSVTSLACRNGSGSILYSPPSGYPSDGKAHAYAAVIVNCPDPGVVNTVSNLASSAIQLTVGWNTTLSLTLQNTSSPVQYRIVCSLMNGTKPVNNAQITLSINDTQLTAVTVNYGSYSVTHDFPAENNTQTTYTVTASFAGTNSSTASATATAPDGTTYTACTTIQFSLQPASNNTVVSTSPQSTLATMLTKSPHEMQKDAESSGWFRVACGFIWGYPWFRLHYKLNVDLPQGNPKLDYGWSPLPFGCSYNANRAVLANVMNTLEEGRDAPGLALFFGGAFSSLVVGAVVSKLAGQSLAGVAWATVSYGIVLSLFTLATCVAVNGDPNYWLSAFVGAAFVLMAELFVITPINAINLWAVFATLMSGAIFASLASSVQTLLNIMGFIDVTGAIFALMDIIAMVFYLCVYLKSVWML